MRPDSTESRSFEKENQQKDRYLERGGREEERGDGDRGDWGRVVCEGGSVEESKEKKRKKQKKKKTEKKQKTKTHA